MLSGEATNTNFIVFGLTRPGLEFTIYRTRGEHANHCATDVVVVSSNPARARCTRYNIYVIMFVCDLRQVGGFLWVSSTNKTDHDITEIVLKVALNIIALTQSLTLVQAHISQDCLGSLSSIVGANKEELLDCSLDSDTADKITEFFSNVNPAVFW